MEEKALILVKEKPAKKQKRKKPVEKKKRRSRKKKKSNHHIIPRSRLGKIETSNYQEEDNLVTYPINFHGSLHAVFGNLIVNNGEASTFLKKISEPGTEWDNKKLERLRSKIKRGEISL